MNTGAPFRESDPAQFAKLQNAMQVEDHRNLLYSYCGRAITFITSLFTAVEATLNRAIPSDYIHVRIETKQSVSRNKQQLMEFASFTDKLQVIKAATGKDFMKHPLQYEKINKLKELRDMIIHPKDTRVINFCKYPELYSHSLRIHFADTLLAVKAFVNYYAGEDVIRDCDCGMTRTISPPQCTRSAICRVREPLGSPARPTHFEHGC